MTHDIAALREKLDECGLSKTGWLHKVLVRNAELRKLNPRGIRDAGDELARSLLSSGDIGK